VHRRDLTALGHGVARDLASGPCRSLRARAIRAPPWRCRRVRTCARRCRLSPARDQYLHRGPLGIAVRATAAGAASFTSSFTRRYPHICGRWPIPLAATYAWLRRFHGAATRTFVSTRLLEPSSVPLLRGLPVWKAASICAVPGRCRRPAARHLRGPSFLVGRLAVEKNLDGVSSVLGLPGTKVMIGDCRSATPWRVAIRARCSPLVSARTRPLRLGGHCGCAVFPASRHLRLAMRVRGAPCGVPVAPSRFRGPSI